MRHLVNSSREDKISKPPVRVVVAVTGGIAAYKSADLILGLRKKGCDVRVIMTENGKRFITELTLATLSGNPVMSDMWDRSSPDVEHIDVAKWAEMFVVYPATANIIAKFALGMADDTLSTVHLALPEKVKKFVFPACNTVMLESCAVVDNIDILKSRQIIVAPTRETVLACGDKGQGALQKPREAIDYIEQILEIQNDRERKLSK